MNSQIFFSSRVEKKSEIGLKKGMKQLKSSDLAVHGEGARMH